MYIRSCDRCGNHLNYHIDTCHHCGSQRPGAPFKRGLYT